MLDSATKDFKNPQLHVPLWGCRVFEDRHYALYIVSPVLTLPVNVR